MKTRKTMKRIVTLLVVLCLSLTALTAGAFADNSSKTEPAAVCDRAGLTTTKGHTASISLSNESDIDIMEFYLAPATDDTWGIDLLGSYYVGGGESCTLASTVTYVNGAAFQVRFVLRGGDSLNSNAFTLDKLPDANSVTFILRGTNGDYTISAR